jgi:hypothetical protein
MVHICNPSTQEGGSKNHDFEAILYYIARLSQEKRGGARDMVEVIECLPSKCKALGSIPSN